MSKERIKEEVLELYPLIQQLKKSQKRIKQLRNELEKESKIEEDILEQIESQYITLKLRTMEN